MGPGIRKVQLAMLRTAGKQFLCFCVRRVLHKITTQKNRTPFSIISYLLSRHNVKTQISRLKYEIILMCIMNCTTNKIHKTKNVD